MTHKLKDLLASTPGIKQAAVEMPNKQQYENDFGKMAYVFLQDRVPQMIPYLVGFEVVEQEPDGTRSVGMFGFRVGERFYYIPVFFINNQIKGMESIYDRESDMMAPLSEKTVNDIINRKTIEVGGPAEGVDVMSDLANPDLSIISAPPSGGTGGGDAGYKYASAMEDSCEVWNSMQRRIGELLEKDAEFQQMFGNAIISMTGGKFEKSAHSPLKTYLTHVGGPAKVAQLFGHLSKDIGFAKAASSFYDLRKDLAITNFDESLAPKKAAAQKVKVITPESDFKDMGEEDGTKMLANGFVIKDDRNEDEKSLVYNYDPTSEITNPTESGVYNVALAGGKVEKCLVLFPSAGGAGGDPHMVVVKSTERDNKHFTANADRIFVVGKHENEDDLSEMCQSEAIDPMDAKDNTLYVLVNKEGKTTNPFRVSHATSNDREHMTLRINWSSYVEHKGPNSQRADARLLRRHSYSTNYYDSNELVLRPGKGSLRNIDDSVVVPTEDWKLLPLEKNTAYDNECCPIDSGERAGKPEERFAPASYTEVTESLIKDAMHEIRIDGYDNGQSFLIRVNGMKDSREPVTYKSACVRLVRDFGLPVEDTEIMLKEASTRWKSDRMVKLAQQVQMPNMQQPPAPYPDNTGVPVQQFYDQSVEGNTVPQPPPPGPRVGGEAEMQQGMAGDPNALAQEAAAMGQQQVFDHAAVGGLAGTSDASAMVDTFLPTWIESLDKLGRTLFLFYWKNEEFAERYGSDDMADMEDKLRNVYQKFGELVYELKNKTIEAQAGELM